MKSLLKYLSPFAPDQSGAVSVLFEYGGLIAICDAGGCTGNICGFDEPRWFLRRSAVFSAGLRDMDAILGRDDKLVSKLANAASGTKFAFVAVIGTPVPAIIATDWRALGHMTERRTGLPAVMVNTTGTNSYDRGEEAAYLELFRTFAREKLPVERGTLGVIGATPLEFSRLDAGKILENALHAEGWKNVVCHGMGAGLAELRRASSAEKNLVVAPAGVKAAQWLKETFGTPFELRCPLVPDSLKREYPFRKILVVHQQFQANALRAWIEKNSSAEVDVSSWFRMEDSVKRENDFASNGEEMFAEAVRQRNYDCVVADRKFKRVLRGFSGTFVEFPHFAVSGILEEGKE